MTDETKDAEIIAALDDTAIALLQQTREAGNLAAELRPSIAEQCKVFDSVAGWLATRKKVAPEPKRESRISELRNKLEPSSRAPRRRGDPAPPPVEPEAPPP